MFAPDDNQLEEEEIPLTNQLEEKNNLQQYKVKKIYRTTCDGEMKSTKFFCTNCGVVLYSKVEVNTSKETWFAVIVMCFFPVGGFCLIPLMIDYMKNYIHTCPACEKSVGVREYTVRNLSKLLEIFLKQIKQISKPLKIIMLVAIGLILLLAICFIISAIFFGNAMWEEYKRIKGYERSIENGEEIPEG